jgi:hypothetical protein
LLVAVSYLKLLSEKDFYFPGFVLLVAVCTTSLQSNRNTDGKKQLAMLSVG